MVFEHNSVVGNPPSFAAEVGSLLLTVVVGVNLAIKRGLLLIIVFIFFYSFRFF